MVVGSADPPKIPRLIDRLESRDAIARETEAIKEIENLTASAGFAMVFITFGVQYYLTKIVPDFTMKFFDWVQLALLACIMTLMGLWIHNGRTELGYLQRSIRTGHFRLKSHTTIFFSFILIALFFAILAGTTGKVHWFFAIYGLYLLLDVLLWRLRREEFREPMADATKYLQEQLAFLSSPGAHQNLNEKERRVDRELALIQLKMIESLIVFYFRRRHIVRVLALFVFVAGLESVALLLHFKIASPGSQPWLVDFVMSISHIDVRDGNIGLSGCSQCQLSFDHARGLAYFVFAVLFAGSEHVLWRWRTDMRGEIVALERERDALERSEHAA